jgi:hypothetical protein
MSIFSRVSANLNAVKKLASVAHLGNGISIDAAKSLISKQLSGLTSGLSGATTSLSGAIGTATKIAGVAATVAKISGAGASSGVQPAPISVSGPPVIKISGTKDYYVADGADMVYFDWNITGATTFSIVDARPYISYNQINPGVAGDGPHSRSDIEVSGYKGSEVTVTATNSFGTTTKSFSWSVKIPPAP